jgi:hypothetical protein
MPDETRTLYFSAVDQTGRRLEGALVRFFVKDKLRTEGRLQKDSPFEFKISSKVEFVDVEVWYGEVHAWTKVSMADGNVEFPLQGSQPVTPVVPAPNPAPTAVPAGNGDSGQGPTTPPWKTAAVWAAAIAALSAVLVAFLQYGPKSCSGPPPIQPVKFRVQVLDYSNLAPVSNATVSLADGAAHMDGLTDGNGLTGIFSLPKSNQANLALLVRAGNYAPRPFNLDRPTEDETYTAELQPMRAALPGNGSGESFTIPMAGTWTVQGIGDPNNERITSGTFSMVKQGVGKAVLTAHLHVDNMDVTLTGSCEWHGREAHMAYSATTAQGGSWQGSADLTADSTQKLTGRFLSKRGDDVPLVLVKD